MTRDIPLTHDPLLLADWREAAGLALDRSIAAGMAAPSGLPGLAESRPSARGLAAICEAACACGAKFVDFAAIRGREAELDAVLDRWRYPGDGGLSAEGRRGHPVTASGGWNGVGSEMRSSGRPLSVLATYGGPLPSAPPPGTPIRAESARCALSSAVRLLRRCRHVPAAPADFLPGRWPVRAVSEEGDDDEIARLYGRTVINGVRYPEMEAAWSPSGGGFASAAAWIRSLREGGTEAEFGDADHYAWRVLGDEAETGYRISGFNNVGRLYPIAVFEFRREWGAVQTETAFWEYAYGDVTRVVRDPTFSCRGTRLLPRNPRAIAVLWHVWPGGFDREDAGWSVSDAPALSAPSSLSGRRFLEWPNGTGAPDAERDEFILAPLGAWEGFAEGHWVSVPAGTPWPDFGATHVPDAPDAFGQGAWLPVATALQGAAFHSNDYPESEWLRTGNGRITVGWEADLAILDLGDPPSREALLP